MYFIFLPTTLDDRGIFMEDHIPKDEIEVCLPGSRFLSGLYGMWSSMKIPLFKFYSFCQIINCKKRNLIISTPGYFGQEDWHGACRDYNCMN